MFVFATAVLAACSGAKPPANGSAGDRPLVGTWRAIEFANPIAHDTASAFPYGRSPLAYLVYDRTGHVFFQAVRGVAASPEARGRWHQGDSASLNRLLSDAAAYFGTYAADYGRGTVLHRIEGEIPPNSGTTEVATPFRVSGDTLILGRDSASHWRFLRLRQVLK